jgi:hypothetical protein
MNSIPDATTVAFFRERLRKAELIEELFEMFEANLRSQGLQARGGQISGLLSGCKSLPAKRAPGGSQGRLKVCLHSPLRVCQHWVWSAGFLLANGRSPLCRRRSAHC